MEFSSTTFRMTAGGGEEEQQRQMKRERESIRERDSDEASTKIG
jgi:hypothetical protein